VSSFNWKGGFNNIYYNTETGKIVAETFLTLGGQYVVYVNETKHGYFIDFEHAKKYIEGYFSK